MTRTVACVLNVGDFRRRAFSPVWVQRLQNMVAKHLTDYSFVCLSNVPVDGVETIDLQDGLPGWFAKVELFRPGLFKGRVLYIDLDTLILGELASLFNCPGDFVAMRADLVAPPRMVAGKIVTAGLNSGTMTWTAGAADFLYKDWREHFADIYRGDQDWITTRMPDPYFYPKEWFARLKDCKAGPPEGVKVLHCMPWKNDVAAQRFDWVRDLWV